MKYTKIPFLLFIIAISAISLQAANIYVLFDPSCMDQLEFKQDRSDYYVYHVNIRSGEKLVLEVGEEGTSVQNYIPTPYLSCQTGGFDQALMRRINSNIDAVFMVYPKSDKKFVITRIKTAAYYTKKGSVISYDSPKYRFRFDTEYGVIGENIAVNNPGAKVYFEGRVENDCTGAYLFRQLSPLSAYPLTDLVLIPEVGIVQERSGSNASAAQDNSIALYRMNGKASERYLLEICGTEPGSVGSMVTTYSNTPTTTNYNAPRGGYNPPSGNLPPGAILLSGNNNINTTTDVRNTNTTSLPPNAIKTQTIPQTAQVNSPQTHTIKSGETLYGIARQHNMSVNELKAINGLKSNTIRRGQVLQLQAPSQVNTMPQMAPQNTLANTQNRGFGTGRTISGAMVPYSQNSGRITTSDADVHIVKPGETIASIALNHGYTAKRFREINGLAPNDYAKVGQRLKTNDCNCDPVTAGTIQSNSVTTTPTVPNSYGSTGGRITPNQLSARTPVASPNSGTAIHNSGGLPAYNSPSIPAVKGNDPYNDIVPSAYEFISSTPQRSLSNLENTTTTAREIPSSYNTPFPSSYEAPVNNYVPPTASPYPTPNAPMNYNQPQEESNRTQRQVHIVADGESLYGIARRYGTTTERLRQINNLGPNDPIIAYQTLYLE